MPKADKTPDEAMQDMMKALDAITPHIGTIAHIKKSFYDAYIAEGFSPSEALELTKNISVF